MKEQETIEATENLDIREKKVHEWRECGIGKHYVRSHSLHVSPNKTHPGGLVVTRHQHCASNPSHKDVLSFDEIQIITNKYFSTLSGPPKAGVLTQFNNADHYDVFIRGWVHYWNDIFQPTELLNPNLIKALIATESSFDPKVDNKVRKKIHAHGLMQIRSETMVYLKDHAGELKNYLVNLNHDDLYDPSANICAGVRWLFRKKLTASHKLGREATWEDAIFEYKSYWSERDSGKTPSAMLRLREYYDQLENG